MFFAGSDDICGLNGDNGAIGVGNKSGVSDGVWVSGSIGEGSNGGSYAMGGEVSLLSGDDLGGLGGGDGTVGIGNKTTGISGGVAIVTTIVVVVVTVVSSSISIRISSICAGISHRCDTLGGKVSSLSSDDLGGLGWGNGAIGVGDELNSRGSSHASKENLEKIFSFHHPWSNH